MPSCRRHATRSHTNPCPLPDWRATVAACLRVRGVAEERLSRRRRRREGGGVRRICWINQTQGRRGARARRQPDQKASSCCFGRTDWAERRGRERGGSRSSLSVQRDADTVRYSTRAGVLMTDEGRLETVSDGRYIGCATSMPATVVAQSRASAGSQRVQYIGMQWHVRTSLLPTPAEHF